MPPTSAKTYLTYLDQQRVKGVELGVVSGRYYAMDRDKIMIEFNLPMML